MGEMEEQKTRNEETLKGPSYPVHFVCEMTPITLTSGPYAAAVRK